MLQNQAPMSNTGSVLQPAAQAPPARAAFAPTSPAPVAPVIAAPVGGPDLCPIHKR
tara:strand:- start:2915 stop:3082 length:168 start_codon:yes stop_codon:yes gene_type:complete